MAASGGKSAATPSFCGNWVVALLDIMGYRAALMKMNVFPLPEDEQGQADLNAKVARTYGMRRMFIDSMKNFMASFERAPRMDVSHFSAETVEFIRRWRKVHVQGTGFSDSYVMELPLAGEGADTSMSSMVVMIMACASAALLQLSAGAEDIEDTLPLRGGIDIGVGMKYRGYGELCCSAQAKVAVLEKEADYPRILVGNDLIEMLKSYMTTSPRDRDGRMQAKMAQRAYQMLYQDETDGKWTIDFLSSSFREHAGRSIDPKIVANAWTFVKNCREHWKDDAKLGPRYDRLARYMERRVPIWGL